MLRLRYIFDLILAKFCFSVGHAVAMIKRYGVKVI